MPNGDKLEICRSYLDLARECLNKAARTTNPEEAEQLRRMCRCFIVEGLEALSSVEAEP
jgi:hypothetical protein